MTTRKRASVRSAVGTLVLAGAGLLSATCTACGEQRGFERAPVTRPTTAVVELAAAEGPIELVVELAVTPAERDRGLMHRTELPSDTGMLFVFPGAEPRTFWMRNTLIPLDILFLDADGTVQNIARGEPFVERPGYHSARPARMVLELNAGWCEAHGVSAGTRVRVSPSILDLPED